MFSLGKSNMEFLNIFQLYFNNARMFHSSNLISVKIKKLKLDKKIL